MDSLALHEFHKYTFFHCIYKTILLFSGNIVRQTHIYISVVNAMFTIRVSPFR
jgi:hypothetical protein